VCSSGQHYCNGIASHWIQLFLVAPSNHDKTEFNFHPSICFAVVFP
jgi:hypothetical protein